MIGVFDSGAGGLSVLREIVKVLPQEEYIYFADNAHCPYGEKSREYVTERSRRITEFLIREGAQTIVIACNTATAAAIATLRKEYSDRSDCAVRQRMMQLSGDRQDHIRFIGTEPAVKPAALATKSGTVGVLATAGTLKGAKYISTRDAFAAGINVVEHVGQGFVELVESGRTTGQEAEGVVRESLKPLLEAGADVIVLGCTHYPFLKDTIAKVSAELAPGRDVKIIDPAPAIARHLAQVMQEEGFSGNGNPKEGSREEESQKGEKPEGENLTAGKPEEMKMKDGSPNEGNRQGGIRNGGNQEEDIRPGRKTKVRLVASGDDTVLRKSAACALGNEIEITT